VRYFLAALVPIGFAVIGFSLLAILSSVADSWSPAAQTMLAAVVIWWAHYWWMLAIIIASLCLIAAVIRDAHAAAKPKKRVY
jgi:hypothetical protein